MMNAIFLRVLGLAILSLSGTNAFAQAKCVEEAGGVCLKYANPAPAAPINAAHKAEIELALSAADRRRLQKKLAELGFYSGAIDGALGPKSRKAIAIWQASRKVRATGFVSSLDIAELRETQADIVVDDETISALIQARANGVSCNIPGTLFDYKVTYGPNQSVTVRSPLYDGTGRWVYADGKICSEMPRLSRTCNDVSRYIDRGEITDLEICELASKF